jgi:hypothetical protein
MSEFTELLRQVVIFTSYAIIGFAVLMMTLKSVFYWLVTFSWNYLGRCFCREYNRNPPDGKPVHLDSLRGTGGYFLSVYHFLDYDVPRMLNVDEEVFKTVLEATVKINNAKEKALKKSARKSAKKKLPNV